METREPSPVLMGKSAGGLLAIVPSLLNRDRSSKVIKKYQKRENISLL